MYNNYFKNTGCNCCTCKPVNINQSIGARIDLLRPMCHNSLQHEGITLNSLDNTKDIIKRNSNQKRKVSQHMHHCFTTFYKLKALWVS